MREQTQGLQDQAYWADYWAAEWAGRVARGLPAGDPLREAAERALGGRQTGAAESEFVLFGMHEPEYASPFGRRWCLAVWLAAFVEFTDEQRGHVLPALRDAACRGPAADRLLAWGRGLGMGCVTGLLAGIVSGGMLMALAGIVGGLGPLSVLGGLVVLLPPLACLWTVPMTLGIARRNRRYLRVSALRALGRHGDSSALSVLADATNREDAAEQAVAALALVRLLPGLGTDELGRVDRGAVPALCRMLGRHDGWYWRSARWYWHAGEAGDALVNEVLEALGRFGDGRAVGDVEALAEHFPQEGVRQTAARVLPILRERREQERSAERLLRPAASPAVDTEALLRPTDRVPDAPPEQLLRPASSTGDGGGDSSA